MNGALTDSLADGDGLVRREGRAGANLVPRRDAEVV